jgi:hypothetical protein
MIRKTISSIISRKVLAWAESITDEALRSEVLKGTIVTGGCITSMLLDEPVKDFDIYFTSKDLAYNVATYYANIYNTTHNDDSRSVGVEVTPDERVKIVISSTGVAGSVPDDEIEDTEDVVGGNDKVKEEASKKNEYKPVFFSSNAITLSDKIQLVIRFYGDPDTIHGNYDFVHCTNYWSSVDHQLVLRPEALEMTLCKRLKYIGSKYPLCSVIRTRKFIKRGWNIDAGQYIKMIFQLSRLDLCDIEVLKDQLIGVDSAYFARLITALEEYKANNDAPITDSYVCQLVDKIF